MTISGFPRAFAHYKPRSHKVFGAIVISTQNRILLVKGRKTGIWSFPKGHLKGAETSLECALREMLEETGISMNLHKNYLRRKLFAGEYFFYNVESEIEATPKDTTEISEAGWFSFEEISRMHGNVDVVNLISRLQKGSLVFDSITSKIEVGHPVKQCTSQYERD